MQRDLVIVPICIGLLQGIVAAGEVKVKMNDLPPAVQAAVREQSKGAAIRGLSKEVENGKTEYEAALTVDGHGRDVSFDSAGKVISVEDEIALSNVPEPARAAIQKAAQGGTVRKVELVNERGKSFYEAEIRTGGKSSEIQVDASGVRLK